MSTTINTRKRKKDKVYQVSKKTTCNLMFNEIRKYFHKDLAEMILFYLNIKRLRDFEFYKPVFMLQLDGCSKDPTIYKSMQDLIKNRKKDFIEFVEEIENDIEDITDVSNYTYPEYEDANTIVTAVIDTRKIIYAYIQRNGGSFRATMENIGKGNAHKTQFMYSDIGSQGDDD